MRRTQVNVGNRLVQVEQEIENTDRIGDAEVANESETIFDDCGIGDRHIFVISGIFAKAAIANPSD